MQKKQTAKKRHNQKISKSYKPHFNVPLRQINMPQRNNVTFWMALVVLLVSNFTISIVLIPFLIILEKMPLYTLIFLIGIMFGSLFKLTLDSINNLEKKHQNIATFFIPALAIVNIAVITTLSNKMAELLELSIAHNPPIIGLTYALAFITPFIYKSILDKLNFLIYK